MLHELEDGALAAVFERPSGDLHLVPNLIRADRDPLRHECRRRSGLERPIGLRAVRIRHGDREPRVRIGEVPLLDNAVEDDLVLSLDVEHVEGVMRKGWRRDNQRTTENE